VPVLKEKIDPVEVLGCSIGDGQQRYYVLDNLSIRGVVAAETPLRARIVVHMPTRSPSDLAIIFAAPFRCRRLSQFRPGHGILAGNPSFKELGQSGFPMARRSFPRMEVPTASRHICLATRHPISTRIVAVLGDRSGGLAIALLTGDRGAIPKSALDKMWASGPAHLLAIYGLHIGLVAGTIFVFVRIGLAVIEPLALRYPVKKWVALTALIGSLCYLLLSDASTPT